MSSEEESPIQKEAKRPKVTVSSSFNFGGGGDDDDDDDFQGRQFSNQLVDSANWLMLNFQRQQNS